MNTQTKPVPDYSSYVLEASKLRRELAEEREFRRSFITDVLEQMRSWQAGTAPAGFNDRDPIMLLESYERLSDGPWKRFVWSKNKDILMIAMGERDWRKLQAEAARTEAAAKLPADSLSADYELMQRLDPVGAKKFFELNRAQIAKELEERRLSLGQTLAASTK